MRVLHVNDVADVGATLVSALRQVGVEADLRRLSLRAARSSTMAKIAAAPWRLAELVAADREFRTGRYDLLHIHYAYLGVLAAIGRHPAVLHCHGTDLREGLRDALRRPLVLSALRAARAVLVSTPDLLNDARHIRRDARFLPNPVDTERFRPRPRTDGPLRVLLVSDAHPLKGIERAVPAALALRQRAVVVRAIDRGGADRAQYERLGVTEFVPSVPHAEMPLLFADHDIVVGRFGLGSLGNNELEAMASGRPVVAEFRYDWAYPERPPVLGLEDLGRLADDADFRGGAGTRGRDWVVRHHEARTIATHVAALYRELVG